MKYLLPLAFVLAACGSSSNNNPPPTPPPNNLATINPLDYATGPNTMDTVLTVRRGDWGPNDVPYAFMDAVHTDNGAAMLIWSFAGDTTAVLSHGDGGEVYGVNGNNWVITQTQDGGTPQMQYFVGGTGWVVSPLQVTTCDQGWTEIVATLNIALGSPKQMPLGKAYTRSCLYPSMTFPAIVNGQHTTLTADTVISEHYDGDSIANSHALERTWFAKGYGRIAWAAWTVGGTPVDPSRYPGGLPLNDQTMPNSTMSDVRLATNMTPVQPFTIRSFGWP